MRQGLVGGEAPGPRVAARLRGPSLERLLAWATIGRHVDNGPWCLYGARLGCRMAQLDGFDPALLARPDWIDRLWTARIQATFAGSEATCPHTGYAWDRERLEEAVIEPGDALHRDLSLDIIELEAPASRFFAAISARDFDGSAFDRLGNLYRDGGILPADGDKAARNYARSGRASAVPTPPTISPGCI